MVVPHDVKRGVNVDLYTEAGINIGSAWQGSVESTFNFCFWGDVVTVLMDMGQAQKITFEDYCSDGPGFQGKLEYQVAGRHLSCNRYRARKGVRIECETHVLTLPVSLPRLTGVRAYRPEADASFMIANMDEYTLEDAVETGVQVPVNERVQILSFEDGTQGFLWIHGEPCWLSFVAGANRFMIEDFTHEVSIDNY